MGDTLILEVHLARDEDSGRWYIAKSDIPGLWLEAASAPALIEHIALAAPEMIELNRAEIFAGRATPDARPAIRPVFDSAMLAAA